MDVVWSGWSVAQLVLVLYVWPSTVRMSSRVKIAGHMFKCLRRLQGFVLHPFLFVLNTADLFGAIQQHDLSSSPYDTDKRLSDRITDARASLHWLRVPQRGQFNIQAGVWTLRAQNGLAPGFLSSVPRRHVTFRHVDGCGRVHLVILTSHQNRGRSASAVAGTSPHTKWSA